MKFEYQWRWVPGAAVIAAIACVPVATAQVTVEGLITDEAGHPVSDADLDFFETQSGFKVDPSAPGWESQSDKTDVFGRYEMVVVPEVYDIRYEPPESRTDLAPIFIREMILGTDTVQNVTLPTGARLSGQVLDPFGGPVVAVDLDVRDPRGGIRVATVRDDTDADGRFATTILRGTWNVVFRPALRSGVGPLQVDGVDLTTDAIVNVTLPRGFVVSGRVVREEGPPIYFADLDFEDPDGARRIPTADDATRSDGSFDVNVSEGTRHVFVNPPRGLPYAPTAIYDVNVDRDLDLGTITLTRGVQLQGTVTDESGNGEPAVDVDVFLPGTCDRYPGGTDPTDGTGAFVLRLEPGTYDFVMTPEDGSPLASQRFESVSVVEDGPMVFALAAATPLSQPGSSRVVDETGAARAEIRVRGTPLGVGTAWESVTAPDGAFAFDAIPGRYVIEMEAIGEPGIVPVRWEGVELPCGLASVLAVRSAASAVMPPPPPRALSAFPNPWTSATRLDLDLPATVSTAVVAVYDIAGRRVRELHRGSLPGGGSRLDWNGRDDRGRSVGAGVYFVRVNTPADQFTTKLVRVGS